MYENSTKFWLTKYVKIINYRNNTFIIKIKIFLLCIETLKYISYKRSIFNYWHNTQLRPSLIVSFILRKNIKNKIIFWWYIVMKNIILWTVFSQIGNTIRKLILVYLFINFSVNFYIYFVPKDSILYFIL